jgi:predicted dehydrogenase
MLADVAPDVVVIATPPHVHMPVAVDSAMAGADLLIEKPAVASLADLAELSRTLRSSGVACQVGFQALSSPALAEIGSAFLPGRLGPLHVVSAVGAWWRPDAYYRRTAWAGRRSLDGQPVVDGTVANQFSHAVMQCLAIAGATDPSAAPLLLELERYRTTDIEVDDTACLRITLDNDVRIHAAMTVRSLDRLQGEISVMGSGQARLEYITDRIRLPDGSDWRAVPGRTGLLEDLLAHRNGRGGLVAPLERTAAFTAVLQAVLASPIPALIADHHLSAHPAGGGLVIDGILEALRTAVAETALFSELGVPWATAPHRVRLQRTPIGPLS